METIINSINKVYNTLSYGLSESIYHKALLIELKQHFNIVETEKSVPITYLNHELTVLRADIVIDNKYIIELKAISTKLSDKDFNQINRYMRILNINYGILVNFSKSLEIKDINL